MVSVNDDNNDYYITTSTIIIIIIIDKAINILTNVKNINKLSYFINYFLLSNFNYLSYIYVIIFLSSPSNKTCNNGKQRHLMNEQLSHVDDSRSTVSPQ